MLIRPHIFAAVAALVLTLVASSAFARSFRVDQTPGADFACDLCHLPTGGGLNDFGFDSFQFVDNGNVVWANLAPVDSDGDGYTNGEELGDPDGTWVPGDPIPGGQTDPNDRDDTLCGNGELDGDEECEGSDTTMTCADINSGVGELSCNPATCTFDTSECGACGDDIVQSPREECDGDSLADATCEALGFTGGTLSCAANCQLETDACEGESTSGGGDDGGGSGTTPGTGPGFCGDGLRNNGEACEGGDLGGATCGSLGLGTGVLHCDFSCEYDTMSCSGGNGLSKADEGVSGVPSEPGNDVTLRGEACSATGSEAPDAMLIVIFGVFLAAGIRRRTGAAGRDADAHSA